MLSSWVKSHSQLVNLPVAWPSMKPLLTKNENNAKPVET